VRLAGGARAVCLSACCAALVGGLPRPAGGQEPAAATEDLGALLLQAVTLHQQGRLEDAAVAYEKVLRSAPDAWRVRSNLGAAYVGLGRYGDAIDQYRRALAEGGEDAAIRRNLALALFKAGRWAEAEESARQLVDAQPANRDARLLLAECSLRLGQNDRVVELLTPLAGGDDTAVAKLLGMALLGLDRVKEAQVVLDPVFREGSPESHVMLAAMEVERMNYSQALTELEKARAVNPNVPLSNYLYGECLMQQNLDWEGAASAFRRELELDPNHFESNLFLGNLLREAGKADEALTYVARAAGLRPDSLAVKFSMGALYVSLGRSSEALPLLEAVVAAAPENVPAHMQLAILYHRLDRPEEAARERTTVIRLKKEAEAHSFDSVKSALPGLLRGQTPAAPPASPGEP
jgi:tetratricopeptide (TPR) repeat protein